VCRFVIVLLSCVFISQVNGYVSFSCVLSILVNSLFSKVSFCVDFVLIVMTLSLDLDVLYKS